MRFAGRVVPGREAYSIVIPPPNVTGMLTMGHVLNNTLQDILIRRARLEGRAALWVPGTDHAGIATQTVVERELRKQKLHRRDLGREKFLARVWEWRKEKGDIILEQLRRLGASCDWSRTAFTMDPGVLAARAARFRGAVPARPHLPRQTHGQLVPGLAHRPLRRGGDHEAGQGPALPGAL